jgi:hypothetical protein
MTEPKKQPAGPHLSQERQCPHCGGMNVRVDGPCEREPDMVERACQCNDCGTEWFDVYEVLPYFIGKDVGMELCQDPKQIIEQQVRYFAWELYEAATGAMDALEEGNRIVAEDVLRHVGLLLKRIRNGVRQP